jgi:hypothetical protein
LCCSRIRRKCRRGRRFLEEGKEEDENKNGRERGAEVLKTWCARIVKFLDHALNFFMFFVLSRVGCCCLQMSTRNSTCNLANFLDTVCGGWRRKGGEERRILFWELIVMGLECGDTN